MLAAAGGGVAYADQPGTASDGQQFQNQSAGTQSNFVGTFGAACAPQEWSWQHSLAVDPDEFGGPPASDGAKFTDQDDDVQQPFVALFGTQANTEWVAEHNAVVAHHVMLGAVVPVPCPPAASAARVRAIGTTHLGDALDAARDGKYADASDLFTQFKVIWAAAKPKLSASQAQPVQTAVDQATNALALVNGQPPAQAQYVSALQDLSRAVRTANAAVAQGGDQTTGAPAAPSPNGGPATTAPGPAPAPASPPDDDDSDP